MSSWDSIIRSAIANKRVLEFTYHGHHRVVEPHVYGRKNGVDQLLGYQIGGTSKSGGVPDWRRFDLPDVNGATATPSGFPGPRPYPSGKHTEWDTTYAIVK